MKERKDMALFVRPPWAGKLCTEEKTWEIRTKPTTVRGRVAIIETRTGGKVVGHANLIGSRPATEAEILANPELTGGVTADDLRVLGKNSWFIWQFADGAHCDPYHWPIKQGQVIWARK